MSTSRVSAEPQAIQRTADSAGRGLGVDNNGIDIRPATAVNASAVVEYKSKPKSGAQPYETGIYTITNRDTTGRTLKVTYQPYSGRNGTRTLAPNDSVELTLEIRDGQFFSRGLFLAINDSPPQSKARVRLRADGQYNASFEQVEPFSRRRRDPNDRRIELVVDVHGMKTSLWFQWE